MNGFLIAIFLLIGLVMPALIFMRAYGTAFSGLNKKDAEKSQAETEVKERSPKIADQGREN